VVPPPGDEKLVTGSEAGDQILLFCLPSRSSCWTYALLPAIIAVRWSRSGETPFLGASPMSRFPPTYWTSSGKKCDLRCAAAKPRSARTREKKRAGKYPAMLNCPGPPAGFYRGLTTPLSAFSSICGNSVPGEGRECSNQARGTTGMAHHPKAPQAAAVVHDDGAALRNSPVLRAA